MFLDRYKPAYRTDLKLCEHLKLVTPGTVMAADNIIKPGNPPYLEYVHSTVQMKQGLAKVRNTSGADAAAFGNKWRCRYQTQEGEEKLSTEIKRNPNFVYECRMVNSFGSFGKTCSRST